MAHTPGTIKVLLVDDHTIVRIGLREILAKIEGIEVVGEAGTGELGISLTRELRPDIVIMDVQMPGIGGLEAAARLSRANPDVGILALTAYKDDPYPSQMMEAGCKGYITKGCSGDEVERAIRAIYAGQRYITPAIAQHLAMRHLDGSSPLDALSRRELQVLDMISDNYVKPTEMAETWNISPKTVNSYRYRLYEKLDIKSKTDVELVAKARLYRLIKMGVNIVNPEINENGQYVALANERRLLADVNIEDTEFSDIEKD